MNFKKIESSPGRKWRVCVCVSDESLEMGGHSSLVAALSFN